MASTSGAPAAATTSDFFFGWDLLYKTIETTVNKKADVLIALAHFMLVKHSKFRCIGVGDDKTFTPDESGTELLPEGWNDDDIKYALRYLNENKLYLLLGHRTEDCIIINFLDTQTKKVTNIALEPDLLVKATTGSIQQILPDAAELIDRYRRELVQPVFMGNKREVTTQTTTTQERADPLRISDPMRPTGQFVPVGIEPRPFGFPDVGRGDLDPLGRGGGGNLLEFPPRPTFGDLQPRFDPFGPPERNVRPNPNPDHLPPPNFGGHDYYM